MNINSCYPLTHVFLSARKWQNARQISYALLRAIALPHGRATHKDWFKTRVPDQTPLQPQLIQSGYYLSQFLALVRLSRLAHIFITMGGPQAMDTP